MQANQAEVRAPHHRQLAPSAPGPEPVATQLHPRQARPALVSDITYVPTAQGWLYLAAVLDLGSRKIVGWAMDATMKTTLTLEALRMALTQRMIKPQAGAKDLPLIHHSDRGVQYASDDYQHLLRQYGVQTSMSDRGDPRGCYDNAAMENFWATLKGELVHQERYVTYEHARGSIFEYIEVFYNRVRLHSTLGYQSPKRSRLA
ncbi:MAG: IS3 family transposase [Phycisphaerales bacterium]|nr:IS3 family transposase [Phycisphaerales bacterium]